MADNGSERTEAQDEEEGGLAAVEDGRAGMYGLLSRLYRVELDQQALDLLLGTRLRVKSGNDAMDEGALELARALSNLWENSLTDFAVDYARVFLGGGIDSYSAAYPYESVYTSPKRLLMQKARDEVVAIYRSEGLDKGEAWRDSEDHVALELEFMRDMAERGARALRDGDDGEAVRLYKVQANFLRDHLLNWVPMMTADMRRFARTGLYRGLSRYTEGYLQADAAYLEELRRGNEELFA